MRFGGAGESRCGGRVPGRGGGSRVRGRRKPRQGSRGAKGQGTGRPKRSTLASSTASSHRFGRDRGGGDPDPPGHPVALPLPARRGPAPRLRADRDHAGADRRHVELLLPVPPLAGRASRGAGLPRHRLPRGRGGADHRGAAAPPRHPRRRGHRRPAAVHPRQGGLRGLLQPGPGDDDRRGHRRAPHPRDRAPGPRHGLWRRDHERPRRGRVPGRSRVLRGGQRRAAGARGPRGRGPRRRPRCGAGGGLRRDVPPRAPGRGDRRRRPTRSSTPTSPPSSVPGLVRRHLRPKGLLTRARWMAAGLRGNGSSCPGTSPSSRPRRPGRPASSWRTAAGSTP